jgi:hypothetical protein
VVAQLVQRAAGACDDTMNASYLPLGGNATQYCDTSGWQPKNCTSVTDDGLSRIYCCCSLYSGLNTSMCETRSECMEHMYKFTAATSDGSMFEKATVLFAVVIPMLLYLLL